MDGKFTKRVVQNPKSPSDTTINAPALNLTPKKRVNDPKTVLPVEEQIARFVQGIRLETEKDNTRLVNTVNSSVDDPEQADVAVGVRNEVIQPEQNAEATWKERACEVANKQITDAEQMKARLEIPQGIPRFNYTDQMDDEFFHITCHVDAGLKARIERGEFVELEKLLLKDRPFSRASADNRMGLFTKDGVTYFQGICSYLF